MAKLNVLVWNIRNLTEYLRRPGITAGRGITLEDRISEIRRALNIHGSHRSPYDMVIIIELGIADAKTVLDAIIAQNPEFNSAPPVQINGEVIGVLIRRNLYQNCNVQVTGFKTLVLWSSVEAPSIRNILAIKGEFGFRKKTFAILVVHAPFSKAADAESAAQLRIKYFRQIFLSRTLEIFESDAKFDLTGDIILCGDFNTKKGELENLRTSSGQFIQCGPLAGGGGNACTSLKSIDGILRDGESESQPYDQVWHRPVSLSVSSSLALISNAVVIACGALVAGLSQILHDFANIDEGQRKMRAQPPRYPGLREKGKSLCEQIKRIIETEARNQLFHLHFGQLTIPNLKSILYYVSKEMSLIGKIREWVGLENEIDLGIKKITEFELWVKSTGQFDRLETAAYEYVISDHLPVQFTISDSDN